MKYIYTLFLLFAGSFFLKGQDIIPFPDASENPRWLVESNDIYGNINYSWVSIGPDSLINGEIYNQIIGSQGFIKSENNKIWFFPSSNYAPQVIFDYNLEPSDTFWVPVFDFPVPDSSDRIDQVILIDSIQMNDGSYRRRWKLENSSQGGMAWNTCLQWDDFVWVEGFGGFYFHPFYPLVHCFEMSYDLLCFELNGEVIWGDCLFDNIQEPESSGISIAPNPFYNVLEIKSNDQQIKIAGLYNSLGQKISDISINEPLDLTHLNNGVYFLIYRFQEEEFIEKIIKIRG